MGGFAFRLTLRRNGDYVRYKDDSPQDEHFRGESVHGAAQAVPVDE
jgi:hypothetical protein